MHYIILGRSKKYNVMETVSNDNKLVEELIESHRVFMLMALHILTNGRSQTPKEIISGIVKKIEDDALRKANPNDFTEKVTDILYNMDGDVYTEFEEFHESVKQAEEEKWKLLNLMYRTIGDNQTFGEICKSFENDAIKNELSKRYQNGTLESDEFYEKGLGDILENFDLIANKLKEFDKIAAQDRQKILEIMEDNINQIQRKRSKPIKSFSDFERAIMTITSGEDYSNFFCKKCIQVYKDVAAIKLVTEKLEKFSDDFERSIRTGNKTDKDLADKSLDDLSECIEETKNIVFCSNFLLEKINRFKESNITSRESFNEFYNDMLEAISVELSKKNIEENVEIDNLRGLVGERYKDELEIENEESLTENEKEENLLEKAAKNIISDEVNVLVSMLRKQGFYEEIEKYAEGITNNAIYFICSVAEEATYLEAELEEQKTQAQQNMAQQLQQARENLGGRIAETVQVGNSLNTNSVN